MARNTRFAATLSNAEYDEARRFERAGLCSISQAVKAFEREDEAKIAELRKQLREIEKSK